MSATILRKLSMKAIGATPEKGSVSARVRIAVLLGVITKVTDKPSVYGINTEFTGQFRATNVTTGEVFESNKMFCPSMLEDMINGTFRGEPLEFAVAVEVQPSDKSCGYEYICVPLVETQSDNPLDRLANKLLAAPAAEKSAENNSDAANESKAKK